MDTNSAAARPRLDRRDALLEPGRIPFDDASMEAMLQRIAELAKQVIPAAVAKASVTLIVNDKAGTVAYTGRLAVTWTSRSTAGATARASRRRSARSSGRSPMPGRRPAGPTTPRA
ncbi:MAG: hypothetical protein M3P89_06655, partial [Actinomycetota bacterium]|nr:hypothetical protein [Actinomycetota bacterium]